jgi:D-alanine transfer protein
VKKVIVYHIFPIIIGVSITLLFLLKLKTISDYKKTEIKLITGEAEFCRGVQSNYNSGIQAEINLLGAIKDEKTISIFGSSELEGELYSSYYFLPDSLNIPCVAFGHAFHQNFSIFGELLAARENLKNSKICIILSPSWFVTKGTNIEAFLEFVPSNFLNKILFDEEISSRYKMKIAQFLYKNYNDIEGANSVIKLYKNLEETKSFKPLQELIYSSKSNFKSIVYQFESEDFKSHSIFTGDLLRIQKRIQKEFISNVKSNNIFVYDEYYNNYLLDEKGKYKKGLFKASEFNETQEFDDFLLVLEVLKKYNCNASFVIQPLNIHHYDGLNNFATINSKIKKELEKNNFPYLDLFVDTKKDYEPGTLKDIMHLGDYGWMRINDFLLKTYKN